MVSVMKCKCSSPSLSPSSSSSSTSSSSRSSRLSWSSRSSRSSRSSSSTSSSLVISVGFFSSKFRTFSRISQLLPNVFRLSLHFHISKYFYFCFSILHLPQLLPSSEKIPTNLLPFTRFLRRIRPHSWSPFMSLFSAHATYGPTATTSGRLPRAT